MYLLAKIENDYESFNRLIDFFRFYENMQFSDIDLNITGYFAANQASTLGALLEKLALNINNINITIRNPKTQEILQKNQFLCNWKYQ